ncbi:MAG: DUF1499 domain-containing protein [Devosiaceae bacterium]|nr:DUF1499 domain-containing protein [Devosiaceae bacterium MH13]
MITGFIRMLAWLMGAILVAIIAFFLVGPERIWRTVAGDPDMGRLETSNIVRTGKPNDALLVPPFAADLPDTQTIGAYAVPPDELFSTLIGRIEATGAVRWVERDTEGLYARALTFSPVMKFPDTNHIWVVATEDGGSALFLYAAAQLGQSDLGMNRKRLESWVALLADQPTSTGQTDN